jgi:hypothetical protein
LIYRFWIVVMIYNLVNHSIIDHQQVEVRSSTYFL